ncbi:hypothetical protein RMATCC62417_05550 [Rhizopus microsporus]|nr:hypothetical protein RMATCC62417_05550 [Rhizopus microsporus]
MSQDASNEEQWTFDDFFNVYVMHNKKRVMYHNGQVWVNGDYDSFYTTQHNAISTESIRLVILSSPFYRTGQVVLVDENGLTMGRDRSWDRRLRLPELAVSKFHCHIFLNPTTELFYLVDVGSQHGTRVNGELLSEAKKSSLPYLLKHKDIIEIGSTTLQVHKHPICSECRANEVIDVCAGKKEKKKKEGMQSLEVDRHKWIRQYKENYDISSHSVQDDYMDRAELRRQGIESDMAPPKVIPPKNNLAPPEPIIRVEGVGSNMLKKLGWQEGQGLGKDSHGIKEPIELATQIDRAGLGMKKRL